MTMPVLTCLSFALLTGGDELPLSLQRMVESRASLFKTARIQWRRVDVANPQMAETCLSLYANGDVACARGLEPQKEEDFTKPRSAYYWSNKWTLLKADGAQWRWVEDSPWAHMHSAESDEFQPMIDLRLVGQTPTSTGQVHDRAETDVTQFLSSYLFPNNGRIEFSEETLSDGNVQVVADAQNGRRFTWVINPTMDYAPVQSVVEYDVNGKHQRKECRLEYQQIDGLWFPRRVETLDNGGEVQSILEVEHAEFDRPYHDQTLSIEETLGMLPGTNLMVNDGRDWHAKVYDGKEGFFDPSEYGDRQRHGLIDNKPFVDKVVSGQEPGQLPKSDEKGYVLNSRTAREPRLWENYTRSFIAVNKLDEKQARAAWEVLRDCQRRAFEHLDNIKESLKDLREDRAEAQSAIKGEFGDSQSAQNAEQELVQLEERENKLMEKVEAIFKDLLRPGLFKLLTPEQRKAEAARNFAQVRPEKLTAEAAAKAKP